MSPQRHGGVHRAVAVALLAGLLLQARVVPAAPPMVSQFIGTTNAIVDEFGFVLPGTDPESDEFGVTVMLGDLVQVLHATDGIIHPPSADGTPYPNNLLLHTTRIGLGVSPTFERSGKFGAAVSPRPPAGARIFCRVFNATSLEGASYYDDSSLFTVSHTQNTVFYADLDATLTPLDTGDDNDDGVSNSMEKSYAGDRDGDGVSTWSEMQAGTDPKDLNSSLSVQAVMAVDSRHVRVRWGAVPGKRYRLELAADGLCNQTEYVSLATVTACGATCEAIIQDCNEASLVILRVVLIGDAIANE